MSATGSIDCSRKGQSARSSPQPISRVGVPSQRRSFARVRLRIRELSIVFDARPELALSLKNPQVAEVYDFGSLPDANAFLVTEHVTQATLRQELRKADKLPMPLTITILSETAEALHSAHRAGSYTGYLKPESIALIKNETGEIKNVRSSGSVSRESPLARSSCRGRRPGFRQGESSRTMTYLSPEQFRGEEADLRADIYSLGVIGYDDVGRAPAVLCSKDWGVWAEALE